MYMQIIQNFNSIIRKKKTCTNKIKLAKKKKKKITKCKNKDGKN